LPAFDAGPVQVAVRACGDDHEGIEGGLQLGIGPKTAHRPVVSEDGRPEQLGGSFSNGGLTRALNARDEDQQALRAQSQLRHGVLFPDADTMVRLKQRTRNRPAGTTGAG
jgi:hypothetical protein